ncbi:methyltransferase domain-containing protein [Candidatus Poriferisodalis sp.]|uniref:class I SAM-dependent methyltransferase n=1 Tax=Candidatus Poriferisodalis sp. TaxID=3101277 RepID=UPI003B51D5C7
MSQQRHPLLPTETHDETARESFVQALKSHIATRVSPGVREVYDGRVRDRWVCEHGAEPADRHEVREALSSDMYYRLWSSVRRSSQHLLWSSVGDAIARQADELAERARAADVGLGTLRLDPDLEIPWYNAEVDIHAMPGGYRGEYMDGDVGVGALFDRGVYVYAMGQIGALNDNYGQSVCRNFLAVSHPEFSPRRILDMGCTSGNSTLPYVDAFPAAEVHAIDLGAPVLRYAHARAESLGRKVHFSQQNAECTDFPDGHFDLIVSHIVIHEMSPAALRNTLAECRRLLAPGGLMVHGDFAGYAGVDPVTQAMIDWDTYYNHEPFWGPMRDMDLVAESVSAGFDDGAVEITAVPTGRVLQTGKKRQTGQLTLLVGHA